MTELRPFLRRAWSALLLGTQVLTGAVPLADALLEGRPDAELHIEARGGEPCAVVHDHLHCALCQHLSHLDAIFAAVPDGLVPAVQHTPGLRAATESDLAPDPLAPARPLTPRRLNAKRQTRPPRGGLERRCAKDGASNPGNR